MPSDGGLSDASRAGLVVTAAAMNSALGKVPSIVTHARAAGTSVAAGAPGGLFGAVNRALMALNAVEGDLNSGKAELSRALRTSPGGAGESEFIQAQAALEAALSAARADVKDALSPKSYKGKPLPPCPGGSIRMMLTERMLTLPVVMSSIDVQAAEDAKAQLQPGKDAPAAPPSAGAPGAVALGTGGASTPSVSNGGSETRTDQTGLEAGIGTDGPTAVLQSSTKIEEYDPSAQDVEGFKEVGVGGRAPDEDGDGASLDIGGKTVKVPWENYEEAVRVREERLEGESLRETARRIGADASVFPPEKTTPPKPEALPGPRRSTERTSGVGMRDGTLVAEAGQTDETRTVQGSGDRVEKTTNTGSLTYGEDGLQATGATTDSVVNPDGSSSDLSRSVGVGVKDGQVTTTGAVTAADTDADGVKSETSLNGSLKLGDGETTLSGGAGTKRTTPGDDSDFQNPVAERVEGESVTGSATVSDDGFKASAGAEIQRGDLTFSLGGGLKVEKSAPKPTEDGRFAVTYKITESGSAGGGMGPLSGSMKHEEARDGVRTFGEYADAEAFYRSSALQGTSLGSTEDVDELQTGSEHTESSSDEDGAGLAMKGQFISVEVAIKTGQSKGLHVVKVDDKTVRVTLRITDHLGASVGVSGSGLGGSAGTQDAQTQRVVVQIKLDDPAGRVALNYILDKQALPKGDHGVKVLSRTHEDTSQTANGASAIGVSTTNSGHATASTTQGGGEVQQNAGRTSQTKAGLDLPLIGEVGPQLQRNHSHGMGHTEVDGDKGLTTGTSVIDDSSADTAATGLADALDAKRDMDLKGDAAGKWTVTTGYSPQQIQGFLRAVEAGQVNPTSAAHRPVVARLRAALKASGDPVRRQEAFNAYIKSGGATAMAEVRTHATGEVKSDLALEDSELFTGTQGRLALEASINDYRSRVATLESQEESGTDTSAARTSLATAIKVTLEQQEELQGELACTDRNQEIPPSFRSELQSRCRANIRTLKELLGQAGGAKALNAAASSPEEKAMADQLAFRDRRREGLQEAREDLRLYRRRHDGPRSAREMLGYRSTMPLVSDGPEADIYDRIDRHVSNSEGALYWARKNYKDYQEGKKAGDLEGALIDIQDTNKWYGQATLELQKAMTFYGGIEQRHRSKNPGWFD